ncbi:MarR family transcriptional regulator [Mesorhizobium sp. L-8-10]|nr:MarR family transcriptional regulator [Mesorhizobium sp. L-8-10]
MRWQDATQAYDDAVGESLQLNAAERRCLSFLYGGAQPAGAIAGATGLTPAAVTALIDRLEARGLLRRTRSAKDRRKVMVETTGAMEEIAARYYRPIGDAGARFLQGFTSEELATILRFLQGATELQQKYRALTTTDERPAT